MPAIAESDPWSVATTRACGWNLRKPAPQELTRLVSSGFPQMRISPFTVACGEYATSWAAGATAAPAQRAAQRKSAWALIVSIELLQLLADVLRGKVRVRPVLLDDRLTLAREDEAQELAHFRIHCASRPLVHIDVGITSQRVTAIGHDVRRERDRRATVPGKRDHLHVGIARAFRAVRVHAWPLEVHERTPADRILVPRDRLVEALAPHRVAGRVVRGLLPFDEFLEVGIPLVRPVQHHALEAGRESRRHVAVGLDLLVGPVAFQADLAPGPDVLLGAPRIFRGEEEVVLGIRADLPASAALGAEDAVELFHRKLCERVVLVDHDRPREQHATHVVPAGGDRDL